MAIVPYITNPWLLPAPQMANIEYWECNLCHKSFPDKLLTQGVSNSLAVSATGHKYGENDKCTDVRKKFFLLTLGNNLITIEKRMAVGMKSVLYNLYKYTAPEDWQIASDGKQQRNNTCGTLWESPYGCISLDLR